MDQREKEASLVILDSPGLRVRREKEDRLLTVMELQVLLVLVVYLACQEKRDFLVHREKLVNQAATLKGLVEREVRREALVRKERGEWKESLLSDHQVNQDSLDPPGLQECQLVLPSATLQKEPLAHLDLQDCKESWGKKVIKETPVFSVKALAHLENQAPKG